MSLPRRRALAAMFAFVSFAGVGAALGAPIRGDDLVACRNKGQVEVRKDGWLKIMAPPVTAAEGPREIVDFSAPPNTPNILYATNGAIIKNSVDGGCNWNVVSSGIDPPETPVDGARPDVFTHLVGLTSNLLWAAGYDDVGGVPHPHVYQFADLDKDELDESRIENGLPTVGRPIDLVATRLATTLAYLLVEEPPDPATGSLDPAHRLYVTILPDSPPELSRVGTIWRQVPAPTGFGRIEGVAMGPGGHQIWVWSDTGYATTKDATADAVDWVTQPSPGGRITAIDVNSAGEALVVAQDDEGFRAEVADRTGTVEGATSVPVLPTSMAHGRTADVRVVSGEKGTWGFDQRARRWIDITPAGAGALRGLTMGSGLVERIVLGHTDSAIYRFDTYAGETFLPVARDLIGRDWPDLPYSDITEPYLKIRPRVVTVEPGKTEEADVEFGMPPTPHPLDVFFVVDTTGSMGPAIQGLRKDIFSIASRLRRELGDDVCFGVGDVKDASASINDVDKVYRTHQTITCEQDPALPSIAKALEELQANGGGSDPPEAQTIALEQMVNGLGHPRPLVMPGRQARFRDEAFKVAVLISDINFNEGPTTYGTYPTIEQAAGVLRVNGVKVVSVLTQTNWDPALGRAAMSKLAELTDSFAPAGGVDCDGDGTKSPYDIGPGDPLVCETGGSEPDIGPAITALLLGVVDPGTVAVHVTDPDDVVGAPTSGATSRIMNLKRASKLPFTLPVTCTPKQDGQDLTVTLVPTVRALPVGITEHLLVRCRSVPVDPVPPPEPRDPPIFERPIHRQVLAVALVPPVNPPAQPISNINLNAGFSQQEEQQFQLAAVTQGAAEGEDAEEAIELAMLGRERPERATPAGAFIAGAMMLTAGAALMHRRRLQRSASPAYRRIG